ncbi:unnamed protein product [Protopolystoma xenopodis]|uniref:Uncharacterized protein n=1 Tax=Protopolystoma xenopodis TaxID=117903 RepID=A0A448WKI9_9PLAT|nr:unnamed protein product [Protopolystoma xenopodis]
MLVTLLVLLLLILIGLLCWALGLRFPLRMSHCCQSLTLQAEASTVDGSECQPQLPASPLPSTVLSSCSAFLHAFLPFRDVGFATWSVKRHGNPGRLTCPPSTHLCPWLGSLCHSQPRTAGKWTRDASCCSLDQVSDNVHSVASSSVPQEFAACVQPRSRQHDIPAGCSYNGSAKEASCPVADKVGQHVVDWSLPMTKSRTRPYDIGMGLLLRQDPEDYDEWNRQKRKFLSLSCTKAMGSDPGRGFCRTSIAASKDENSRTLELMAAALEGSRACNCVKCCSNLTGQSCSTWLPYNESGLIEFRSPSSSCIAAALVNHRVTSASSTSSCASIGCLNNMSVSSTESGSETSANGKQHGAKLAEMVCLGENSEWIMKPCKQEPFGRGIAKIIHIM